MKTIITILGIAFAVIAICMVILLQRGVSLRTAPIIKQSLLSQDELNIATGIALRLYPDFQQADYVVWNLDQNSGLVQKNLGMVKNRLEKELKYQVSVIYDGENITAEKLKNCAPPCWIYFPPTGAHAFDKHEIFKYIETLSPHYFTITWNEFTRNTDLTEHCRKEQRLTLDCVNEASVNEVKRKLKDPGRYFFMRKYQDYDYFLFVESENQK